MNIEEITIGDEISVRDTSTEQFLTGMVIHTNLMTQTVIYLLANGAKRFCQANNISVLVKSWD